MNEEEIVSAEPTAEPAASPTPNPQLEEISQRVEHIDTALSRPLLSTPLEDYTVSEGLLLGLLIAVAVFALFHLLRRAFSWL